MNMKKQRCFCRIIFILIMLICMGLVFTSVSYASVPYGSCGDGVGNVRWSFNASTGTLDISGKGEILHGEIDSVYYQLYWWTDYNSQITKVVVHEGITAVGERAFADMGNLVTVTLPNSVIAIGKSAFSGCSKLKTINITDNITSIGSYAFNGCSSLETIHIPAKLKTISESSFENCSSLKSISIPSGVTAIGYRAFAGCSSLLSLSIPDSVTELGYSVFTNCSCLGDIKIPDSLLKIGTGAFSNTAYYSNEGNWQNGVLYIGHHLIEARQNITGNYSIRRLTVSIADSAFRYCKISSVEFPSSLVLIGDSAFEQCPNLSVVTIPGTVKTIGNSAFQYCSSLTDVTIEEGVEHVGSHAFEYNSNLDRISFPSSLAYLGGEAVHYSAFYYNDANWDGDILYIGKFLYCAKENVSGTVIVKPGTKMICGVAFYECEDLEGIVLPDGLEVVDYSAFADCSKLKSISLPGSVRELGYQVLGGCSALESVTLPSQLGKLPERAFSGCTVLSSVIIPESVSEIGTSAFSSCKSLTSIIIPANITEIKANTFNSCSKLANITFSSNLKSIGERAFFYNSSLKNIQLPDGLESIGNAAFGLAGFIDIYFPDTLKKIGNEVFWQVRLQRVNIPASVEAIGHAAFGSVQQEFKVDPGNVVYMSDKWGVLYTKDQQYLIEYPEQSSWSHYSVSDETRYICRYAIDNYYGLYDLYIPKTVAYIGPDGVRVKSGGRICTYKDSVADVYGRDSGNPTSPREIPRWYLDGAALSGIKIYQTPSKPFYYTGHIDFNDLYVEQELKTDSGSKNFWLEDYTIQYDKSAIGAVTVTVSYKGFSKQFTISVYPEGAFSFIAVYDCNGKMLQIFESEKLQKNAFDDFEAQMSDDMAAARVILVNGMREPILNTIEY